MENRENSNRPLEIKMPLKVQTYDIDFMGIVSNISYVKWLEDLRLYFLETHYPLNILMKDGDIPIVQMTQIEYKRPVRLFDNVTGCLWMQSFESPKWTARMEIWANDKLCTSCMQTGVFISLSSLKPSKVPEKLQNKFDEDIKT
jgi:Predicted thioesterase